MSRRMVVVGVIRGRKEGRYTTLDRTLYETLISEEAKDRFLSEVYSFSDTSNPLAVFMNRNIDFNTTTFAWESTVVNEHRTEEGSPQEALPRLE